MKSLLNVYKGMGRRLQTRMESSHAFPLPNSKPIIDQTPGRLQYYKAENEPFIPDNVKWALRMPTSYAMRAENLDYLPEIKAVIENYVNAHFKYDIQNGKELNIEEMTLGDLKKIYMAQSEKVQQMQKSGELQQLHKDFEEVENAYLTSHLKINDALDRALVQIAQAEDEIYTALRESDNRLRLHNDDSAFSGLMTISQGDIALNNLQLAGQMGESNSDHAIQENLLRQLVGARGVVH